MISILFKVNFHCSFANWLVRVIWSPGSLQPVKCSLMPCISSMGTSGRKGHFPGGGWVWAPGPDHCSGERLHSPTISIVSPCQLGWRRL